MCVGEMIDVIMSRSYVGRRRLQHVWAPISQELRRVDYDIGRGRYCTPTSIRLTDHSLATAAVAFSGRARRQPRRQ